MRPLRARIRTSAWTPSMRVSPVRCSASTLQLRGTERAMSSRGPRHCVPVANPKMRAVSRSEYMGGPTSMLTPSLFHRQLDGCQALLGFF